MGYTANSSTYLPPFTKAEVEVLRMLPKDLQADVRLYGPEHVLKLHVPEYFLPDLTRAKALLGLVAVSFKPGSQELAEATRLMDEEQARKEDRADDSRRQVRQAGLRDGGCSDPEADKHAPEDGTASDSRVVWTAPQWRVYGFLPVPVRARIGEVGLEATFEEQRRSYGFLPRLQADFGLSGTAYRLLTLLQWAEGTDGPHWAEAKTLLLAEQAVQARDRDLTELATDLASEHKQEETGPEGGWQHESLEFDGVQLPLLKNPFPMTPTGEQAKWLNGAEVVVDGAGKPTPPAGPVVRSAFHDIVEAVKAVPMTQRRHLFAELYEFIPLATVTRFLEQDATMVSAALQGLSVDARELLAHDVLRTLDEHGLARVLGRHYPAHVRRALDLSRKLADAGIEVSFDELNPQD